MARAASVVSQGLTKILRGLCPSFTGGSPRNFSSRQLKKNHWWLAFEALQDEKTRKECLASLKKDKAQAQAQAQAQVLGSSPSLTMIDRLASMYESPYKQVPSSPAESSAQGSAHSTSISESAQVRPCSPKLQPGEVLSPVQLVCRMYTPYSRG